MARRIAGSPPCRTGEIQLLADPMASAVSRVLLLVRAVASSLTGRTDALRSLGVGDEAGVGGEMVSDGRDEAGSLGVKRAFVEVFARALFYPTVMLNYGRSLIEPEFHWWDRIDKVSSRLYSSSSFTGRILRENSKGRYRIMKWNCSVFRNTSSEHGRFSVRSQKSSLLLITAVITSTWQRLTPFELIWVQDILST